MSDQKPLNLEEYADKHRHFYVAEKLPVILKKSLEMKKGGTLLDCGCGDGNFLWNLKRQGYFSSFQKIIGVDYSSNRIDNVRKISQDIRTEVDSAETLDKIESDSIDVFISTQVIEHVNNEKMVAAIDRVSRSHAIIYLTTVFKKKWAWYFYRNARGEFALDPTHLIEYTSDEQLLSLFPQEKFELVSSKKQWCVFPLVDFLLHRVKMQDHSVFNSWFVKLLRLIRLPVPGYYNWEIVLKKK